MQANLGLDIHSKIFYNSGSISIMIFKQFHIYVLHRNLKRCHCTHYTLSQTRVIYKKWSNLRIKVNLRHLKLDRERNILVHLPYKTWWRFKPCQVIFTQTVTQKWKYSYIEN